MANILPMEDLKQLESLYDEGVITEEELKSKAAAMMGFSNSSKKENFNVKSLLSRNLITIIISVILIVVIIILSINLASNDTKYSSMRKRFTNMRENYRELNDKVVSYKKVLSDFYVDNAVVVIDNGDNHYHRYNCPATIMSTGGSYSFWVYNVEAAKGNGYTKCPTCFSEDVGDYIENNF